MVNNDFTILLHDTCSHSTKLIYNEMHKAGYNIKQEDDTLNLYEYVTNNHVDLLIINSDESSEEEIQIIEHVKSISITNIIFLTNDIEISSRKQFIKCGLLGYKIKLNNILTIIHEITTLIQKLVNNKNHKILLIKKDNDTRSIILKLLKQRCYEVEVVSTGTAGWKAIDDYNISMIILDINLNDINSHDLVSKARSKISKTLPILALTNKYDPLQLQDYIQNGLSDFIKIPVIHEEFNLKIELWMNYVMQSKLLQKQQAQLEQSLDGFKALTNATIEGLVMFDNNICMDTNDAALHIFEYEEKNKLIGKNILDIVSSNITLFDKEELLKNNVNHEFEIIMRKKNGLEFPAQIKETNIIINSKDIKIIAVLDLSEIKRKEKMLSQQSKMAAMGEMIGNIAHQWRQPLSSISIGASSIKVNHELNILEDNELYQSLDDIVENTEFLSNTISDFQSFLKNDAIKTNYEPEKIVKKVLKLVDGNIKSAKIDVIQSHKEDILLYGLENELTQSLLNIVNNARDALKDQNINPKLILIDTYLEKNNVIISIQDNAGGIPNDIINNIFEPYFTTKHKSQGTGLGLYMTHQMIHDHMNGKIEIVNNDFTYENDDYTGALFKVILPNSK